MSEEPNVSGEENMEAADPEVSESSHDSNEQQTEEQNVPLAALQSERAQRQQLQDEIKMMKEHMSLIQANQVQQRAPEPKDELDDLDEGDVLTVGGAKKFLSKMNKQYQMSIEELKMSQKHPDYQEIITKYLPEVIKNNPGLRNTLESTQDYELAYYLAKNSDVYRGEKGKAKKNADAERIVQNSKSAGSLSSVGSTTPISQAKRYKDMPVEEFRNLVNRNLGGP
jgi:hypothetical protein